MISIVFNTFVLGVVAGISPGPLTALVISESINHGRKAGYVIAAVPLLTDLPIITFSIYLLQAVEGVDSLLAVVSLAGAMFLLYLAYNIYFSELSFNRAEVPGSTWIKGIITNYLNPYPYIFWLTVGAPTIVFFGFDNFASVVFYILSFYFGLVGSKMFIVELTVRSKSILTIKSMRILNKLLAIILIVFAIEFIVEFYNRIV